MKRLTPEIKLRENSTLAILYARLSECCDKSMLKLWNIILSYDVRDIEKIYGNILYIPTLCEEKNEFFPFVCFVKLHLYGISLNCMLFTNIQRYCYNFLFTRSQRTFEKLSQFSDISR